jgi:hypothetical protein
VSHASDGRLRIGWMFEPTSTRRALTAEINIAINAAWKLRSSSHDAARHISVLLERRDRLEERAGGRFDVDSPLLRRKAPGSFRGIFLDDVCDPGHDFLSIDVIGVSRKHRCLTC